MSKPRTSTTKAPPKDGFLEMIKKILGSAPKKTTGGKPSLLPLMHPMAPKKKTTQQVVQVKKSIVKKPSLFPLMPPMAPKKKTTQQKTTQQVVQVKKSVSGKPGSKKPTTTKVKPSKPSGADKLKPKMKGGCASMYKGKGAGCTKGKIGGNFGYFF